MQQTINVKSVNEIFNRVNKICLNIGNLSELKCLQNQTFIKY